MPDTPAPADDGAKLGPFLAMMLVATGMIGSGVYLLPASLGAIGSIAILGWIGALLGTILIAGVFSALAALRPDGGGLFAYIQEAFGPGVGFVVGVLYWLPVTNVPIAMTMTGYLSVFIPQVAGGMGATICTLAIIWISIGFNLAGARFVARLSGWTMLVGAAPVARIAVIGWFAFHPAIFSGSWNVSGHGALAIVPNAVVVAFWAFVGIENAVIVAPLMRNPARNVAVATFGALALAAVLYLAASTAIMGMIPAATLAKSSAPFADATRILLGASVAGAVAICALLKAGGTLVGGTLISVETAESEAVLGQLLPHRKPRRADDAPKANLIVLGVIMTLIAIGSTSPTLGRQFTIVAEIAVVLNLLTYLAACLALLRFAWTAPRRRRLAISALAIGGALFCCGTIAASETALLAWTAGAVVIAILLWLTIRLRRARTAAA